MKYEQYKSTGILWLPQIPVGWDCLLLSQAAKEQCEKRPAGEIFTVMSLSYGNVIRKKNIDAGLVPASYDNYQVIHAGNIILRLTDLQNDHTSLRTGLVKETGIITSAYTCLAPVENSAYLQYLLHSYDTRKVFYGMGGGVRQSIVYKDIRSMKVPIPPRTEQDQIVRYLDWQVSKINRLIAAKKREIELLKERRDNKIESIVLHGLSHTTKLHNEFVHDYTCFPIHWQVIQNKRLFTERIEHTITGTEPLLSVSKHYGVKPCTELTEDEQFATIKPALSLIGYKVVKKNDLAMNIMRARNGSYGISDFDGIVSPAYCVYQLAQHCNAWYIHYLLRTKHVKSLFEAYSKGIAEHRRRLYADDFLRLYTLLPPEYEQKAIVAAVKQANTETETVINSFQKQIDVLCDLRSRLVSDVVTGQIDVRDVEIPDFEMVEESANGEDEPGEDELLEEADEQEE